MSAANYDACYRRVRQYEGGNSDNLRDPGGRTSRGVTQAVYDAYKRRKGERPGDVWKATEDEIAAIYRLQYWDAVKGDDLPPGVDLVVFDGAINSGPKQSIKWLQAALNTARAALTVDGVIGQATLDAVDADIDHDALIAEICSRRMGFLKSLKTWGTFGKGWSARVASVQKYGQAMASGVVKTAPSPDAYVTFGEAPKAVQADMKTPPVSAATAIGTVAGGLSLSSATDWIQKAKDSFEPIQDLAPFLKNVFIALTVIGVLFALYAVYRDTRAKKAETAQARAAVPEG